MMWNGGYGMMGWGGGWGFGILHMLLSVVVFVLVVAFIASLFTHGTSWRSDPRAGNGRSAGLGVLEERYARGEIDRDEYLQKKRDLLA
jgi:putative membrane protein